MSTDKVCTSNRATSTETSISVSPFQKYYTAKDEQIYRSRSKAAGPVYFCWAEAPVCSSSISAPVMM